MVRENGEKVEFYPSEEYNLVRLQSSKHPITTQVIYVKRRVIESTVVNPDRT